MSIFISYSHKDSDFAEKLAYDLVQHRAKVWIDKWELNVGDSILDRIQNAIGGATALLIILSTHSVQSEWCRKELNSGLMRELEEKRVIVLPVLIDDCTVPLFLRDKKRADFRVSYDEGLEEVLTSVASISSDTLGHQEEDKIHVDWSIDHGETNDGNIALEITIVEQHSDQPFSVITTVRLFGDSLLTSRHDSFRQVGLDSHHRSTLVSMVAELVSQKKIRLLLDDEHQKTTDFVFRDLNSDLTFTVYISSRRLGNDTGRDILLDVDRQLTIVSSSLRDRLRPLTSEEQQKWMELLSRSVS